MVWLGVLSILGCGVPFEPLPADPDVTFAAHQVHGGLMVDDMRGGDATVVAPAHWVRLPGQAAFVVAGGPARGEGIWLTRPGGALVRESVDPRATLVGRIEPSWDDNAIRLTIEPSGNPSIRTDLFRREDVGGGVSVLSRLAQLSIDVPGTYRATLHAADGSPVGWFRVRLGLHQASPAMFDAVFPVGLDEGLAAACAVALGSEVDWIEDHTIDVYRGS